MRNIVISLGILIGILLLGIIAWFTEGSPVAFLAGVLLLGFVGALLAATVGILTLPALVRSIVGWAIVFCLIIIFWTAGATWWQNRQIVAQQASSATPRPPPPQVVAQNPGEHKCLTPCSVGIYWPFRIEGPGVKLEIDAPLKGGDRHKFVFGPEGKFDFSAEKNTDGSPFSIWKGEYRLNTPDKPGMLITIFEEKGGN